MSKVQPLIDYLLKYIIMIIGIYLTLSKHRWYYKNVIREVELDKINDLDIRLQKIYLAQQKLINKYNNSNFEKEKLDIQKELSKLCLEYINLSNNYKPLQ